MFDPMATISHLRATPRTNAEGASSAHVPTRSLPVMAAVLGAFIARLWAAHGTFLNPDEALHFRLANQPSLSLAYQESLTASHPPLLTFVLYYWRALGNSELWLRMPLVLAGTAFCWIFYKWLAKAGGKLTGFVGLLFVAFLPTMVLMSAEIRQYPLLLLFLSASLYFLDGAFTLSSPGRMAAFAICLYLAMLSHYSAFLFAAALGIYALSRIFVERPPMMVVTTWAVGQAGGLALSLFLYKSHLSKLHLGSASPAIDGWMSDRYLRREYFDPVHEHRIPFLLGHSFGVFQYLWGQLVVGDLMGLLFLIGIFVLVRPKGLNRLSSNHNFSLCLLLIVPFLVACAASMAHIYPYGGTRHIAFLFIPAIAGVSVALAWLASHRSSHAIAAAWAIIVACVIIGKPRNPWMSRADQDQSNMTAAMNFIAQRVNPSDLIFTDYESDLVLGHYLCRQQPIALNAAGNYEQFSCDGLRVISTNYQRWTFQAGSFEKDWRQLVQDFALRYGSTVWVVQMEWDAGIFQKLSGGNSGLGGLQAYKFGKNIEIFKIKAGQDAKSLSRDDGVMLSPSS